MEPVAADLAAVPPSRVKIVVIEHPSGVIQVETESSGAALSDFELKQASLISTSRELFEGQVCIPSEVWGGKIGVEQSGWAVA